MPTIDQAQQSDMSGYVRTEQPAAPPAGPAPSPNLQPARSPFMRCPLPALTQVSPDALRQFYKNGVVPQVRLTIPSFSTSGDSTTLFSGGGGTGSGSGGGSGGSSGGGSSSGGSTSSAQQASITTPALAPGNRFTGTIALAKGFQLLSAAANAACRIELYGTSSAMAQDANRGVDVPTAAGTVQNIICDLALDTAPFNWSFQNRMGANNDTPQTTAIYIAITNLSTSGNPITVTLRYVPLES